MQNRKRIKILHIQVLPKLSGVQKVSLEIHSHLDNDIYEKYVLFSDSLDCGDKQQCVKAFESAGATVLFSKKLKREIGVSDIPAFWEIFKLCRRYKFDIVHTNSTKPGIIGRIAAFMARVPFVLHTVHGLAFHKFLKFPKWQFYWACEMFASMFCDRIVVVNKFYTRYFKWFKNKTTTIYNGLDFSKFCTSQAVRNSDDGNVNVLFVGRLDAQKNPLMLLEAAQIIHSQNQNVHFRLVGDGEYMEQCHKYITENGLCDCVTLEGWRTDVATFYQSSDIFAVPSIYEAFGLMFLEAGFYKLPVCSTNVEGIPEVVENNVTGLLCAPYDTKTFAQNLLRLINDKDLRTKMGENGRKRVTAMFNSANMVEDYKQLYQEGLI